MTAMSAKDKSTQLVVIGGGPGGYVAAFHAADLGMKVTIVDPELNPGGVCLYRGCIPSKALLHAAEIIREAAHAKNFGIEFSTPKIDLSKLRGWKDDVVSKLTGGVGQLAKLRKIEHIRGLATFENAKTLKIETSENETYKLSFENAIIATGSSPSKIPGISIESKNVLDSTTALNFEELPGSPLNQTHPPRRPPVKSSTTGSCATTRFTLPARSWSSPGCCSCPAASTKSARPTPRSF